MNFIHFLRDNPAMAFLLLLGLLIVSSPFLGMLCRGKKSGRKVKGRVEKEPPTTRFMGTQMDLAILFFGLLMLLAVIAWVIKAFS